MKKATLILALFLGFIPMLNAQWTSPGNGTTYTLDDLVEVSGCVSFDPQIFYYFISGDITISANDKLYINRNDGLIYITFANDYTITIKGSMEAMGQDEDHYLPIGMGSGHLRFEDASDPSFLSYCWFGEMNGIQIINSDVTFDTCRFHYFYSQQQSSAVNCMNCDPVFTNCEFYSNQGVAISSPVNGQGSPQIIKCTFENNVTSNANQPQINLGPGSNDSIRIVGCTIDGGNNRVGGIAIADLIANGATKVLIQNNYIANGSFGYDQEGIHISSIIEGNQIVNNSHTDNPMVNGSGINLYGVDENNNAIIRNNIITGNLWGVTVFYAGDANLGTEDDWGHNQIHDNGNGGVIYDLYNNSTNTVMAVGNDWGTTIEQEVENHIVHQYDNPELGIVNYIPFVGYDAVNEENTCNFNVSPNPAQGRFTVNGQGTMTITNTLGQTIITKEIDGEESIALPRGLYVVKIGNATRKVIVE